VTNGLAMPYSLYPDSPNWTGGLGGSGIEEADPKNQIGMLAMQGAFQRLGYNGPQMVTVPDSYDTSHQEPAPELLDWLTKNQYSISPEFAGSGGTARILDNGGNVVGQNQYSMGGGLFDYLPAIGSAAVGAAGLGAFGGLGAAADTAALAGSQIGALGGETAAGLGGSGAVAGGSGLTLPGAAAAGGGTAGGTAAGLGGSLAGAAGTAAGATSPSWISSLLPAAGSLITSLAGAGAQRTASNTAADATTAAANAGINQQQAQFAAIQKLLQPYVQAGTGALTAQGNLAGINGNDAQAQAIQALQASPLFTSAQKLGENRILANASATGGLRGGNVQAALAQFNPQLLSSTINDQYSRLGGLASNGQNAAAGVGNAGLSTGNNVSTLLGQIGSSQAGQALANGRADVSNIGGIGSALGQFLGNGGLNLVKGLF
jgi:hypothetical protein